MDDHIMHRLGARYLDQAQQQGRFSRQPTHFYITKIKEVDFCSASHTDVPVELTSPGSRFDSDFDVQV